MRSGRQDQPAWAAARAAQGALRGGLRAGRRTQRTQNEAVSGEREGSARGYPPKGIVTFRNGDTLFNTGTRYACWTLDSSAAELVVDHTDKAPTEN